MADTSTSSFDGTTETHRNTYSGVLIKRPERKKHLECIERLNSVIQAKKRHLQKLQNQFDPHKFENQMKTFQSQQEERDSQRIRIIEEIQLLNKELTQKRQSLSQTQGTLKYKQEDKINEAIKRLEYQLQRHNYTANQERKIVQEIDSLKRSKKSLKLYLAQKAEVDDVRSKLQLKRNWKDHLSDEISEFRRKQDSHQREYKMAEAEIEEVCKELTGLEQEKSDIEAEYDQVMKEFYKQKEQLREAKAWKLEQEKQATVNRKQHIGDEVIVDQYIKERQLCTFLLAYLQQLMGSKLSLKSNLKISSHPTVLCNPQSGHTEMEGTSNAHSCYKKELEENTEHFVVKSKPSTRKQKKIFSKKLITHPCEVFDQFFTLGLPTPRTLSEVPSVIDKVKEKLKFFEDHRCSPVPHNSNVSRTIAQLPSTLEYSSTSSVTKNLQDCSSPVDSKSINELSLTFGDTRKNSGDVCTVDFEYLHITEAITQSHSQIDVLSGENCHSCSASFRDIDDHQQHSRVTEDGQQHNKAVYEEECTRIVDNGLQRNELVNEEQKCNGVVDHGQQCNEVVDVGQQGNGISVSGILYDGKCCNELVDERSEINGVMMMANNGPVLDECGHCRLVDNTHE
ncbi:uncharacterized protein LOC106460592 [Limulus polyphemus]|uniref:Uncharacterized protein LOC106460592 n=1 Tax=Limulus polyphemus TaxID=6850 RepID=A0ABM1B6G0_LIMPO|nr:uncharacterized protein LOC106460592 [Limulus polyphemus]